MRKVGGGTCKHNVMIICQTTDKCEKCSWNPTYFEEKKKKAREELRQTLLRGAKNDK